MAGCDSANPQCRRRTNTPSEGTGVSTAPHGQRPSDEAFVVDGLARVADLDLVEHYVAKLARRSECDIVGLAISNRGEFDRPGARWLRAGFDVGFFVSEWSHFSTILNEVVYGAHSELRSFADTLNDSLLLDTEEQVFALLSARDRIARAGADLEESDAKMRGIAIYVLQVPGGLHSSN